MQVGVRKNRLQAAPEEEEESILEETDAAVTEEEFTNLVTKLQDVYSMVELIIEKMSNEKFKALKQMLRTEDWSEYKYREL